MTRRRVLAAVFATLLSPALAAAGTSFEEQNEVLFRQLQDVHELTEQQMAAIRSIFARSGVMGQGNPAIASHPMTPEQCRAKLEQPAPCAQRLLVKTGLRSPGLADGA